ncbi:MAG: zinc-ribbon domain-containing protein [Monoglobales bacterium]
MYCSKCGKEIVNGVNVCPNCGEVIIKLNNEKIVNAVNTIRSFNAKSTKGLTTLLKICSVVKVIMYAVCGGFIGAAIDDFIKGSGEEFFTAGIVIGLILGILAVMKELIFANIADNTNIIAKNTAENNKR